MKGSHKSDGEGVAADRDLVADALAAAHPLLQTRDYVAAARVIRNACNAARSQDLRQQAATLSNILGTYLSLSGDQKAAGAAYEHACAMDPSPHHDLAAARHQFFHLQEREEARSRVRRICAANVDVVTAYQALVVTGRFALADGDTTEAVACLVRAGEKGRAADLPSLWWDTFLAKKLAANAPEARQYLRDLRQRAQEQEDSRLLAEVSEILQNAAERG